MQKIDKNAHFELRMCGERIAASVYEQTGDLHEALMGASEDWQFDPTLALINRRAELRRQNGGELPKASDFEQDEALVQLNQNWQQLPEHIKLAILALVKAH